MPSGERTAHEFATFIRGSRNSGTDPADILDAALEMAVAVVEVESDPAKWFPRA